MSDNRMMLQRKEFEAVAELSEQWRRLCLMDIDDYPEVRHGYEGALRRFLVAVEANRRQGGAAEVVASEDFLTELRKANLSRVSRYGHGSIENGWDLMQWGCALAGEVGELCNVLKKMVRQAPGDPSPDQLTGDAAGEIADVMIYLDLVAAKLDLVLQRVVTRKFNQSSKKFGFPERLGE